MPSPFFSIITLSYNQSFFLQQCLDSVASQSFTDYEHIVLDPGSTDGSRDILLNFSSQSLVLDFCPDSGPAHGLNNGLSKALGRYILIINSDDYLLEGALRSIYTYLKKHAFPMILFCGGYVEDRRLDTRSKFYPGSTCGTYHALGLTQYFQQGTIISSQLMNQEACFNTMNRTCWDGELVLHLLSKPRITVSRCKEQVAVFVIHTNSISGSNSNHLQYQSDSSAAVRRYYGERVLSLRNFIFALPLVIRLFLKYALDLKLSYWKLTDMLLRMYKC